MPEPQIPFFSKVKLRAWLRSRCVLCDLLASAGCVPWKVNTAWWVGEQLYYCNHFYFRKANGAFVKAWEQGWEERLFTPSDTLNNKGAQRTGARCFQTWPRAEMKCWECLALERDCFSLEICGHGWGNLEVRWGDAILSLLEWVRPTRVLEPQHTYKPTVTTTFKQVLLLQATEKYKLRKNCGRSSCRQCMKI